MGSVLAGAHGDPIREGCKSMIRTFIDLPLVEGEAERLQELFRQLRILEACMTQPGCRSAELTIAEDGSRAIATAVWDDHDAYTRWLDHPDRAGFALATADLLETPIPENVAGGRFRIAHRVTSRGGRAGHREESR